MTTFRLKPHMVEAGRAAIEVLGNRGELLAVLYATDDQHLKLVSKHLDHAIVDRSMPSLPAVNITLRKP